MAEKILDILKNSNQYISGEKIAKSLNISRAAVWKNIKKLRELGYNIVSITNKGYLLIDNQHMYNKMEIEKEINTYVLGKNLYYFDEIDSTNSYAKKLNEENVLEGTLVVADSQTSGKGRLERKWVSEKGDGIYFSLILKPDIELFSIAQITLLAGICICNAINKCTGLNTKIKWPNDIIIDNKKVCGILTEIAAQIDRVSYVILGIGINANNKRFSDDLKDKATSLFLETGNIIKRQTIIGEFLSEFEQKYFKYIKEKDFSIFLDEYKSKCININKECRVILNKKEIVGKVIDISPLGEVILETDNKTVKISSGEVSLRGVDGEYV